MPPKANKNSMEDLQHETLEKLSVLTEKFETMETLLRALTREKDDLKRQVEDQATEIAGLRNSLNEREQYARNWSMRCLNLPVPADKESDTRVVMQCVYDALLLPILKGAKEEGSIPAIPDCDSLLETAHILPGKSGAKPVIARFYSRYWRNLIFRHRREHAPKTATSTGNHAGSATRMRFPFFEDLTRATFQQLSAIKEKKEVTAAWTVNGSIRFKIKDSETVYKIGCLTDKFEDIVG